MKHIKPYQIFENQKIHHSGFVKTEEEIHELCKRHKIENYTINNDLSIDVDGDVIITGEDFEYLPLNFNYVSGDVEIVHNLLITLIGCPKKVGGYFMCFYNQLITLEGSPKEVGGAYQCYHNNLTSLEYCAVTVGGKFLCSDNNLTTLKGAPSTVNGDFDCGQNELTSLEYAPDRINGGFDCSDNNLLSLKYLPKGINYHTYVTDFSNNPIYSVINIFIKKYVAEELVEEFKEYSIVRGDTIIFNRLKTFCEDFDLSIPDFNEIVKHYKIQ